MRVTTFTTTEGPQVVENAAPGGTLARGPGGNKPECLSAWCWGPGGAGADGTVLLSAWPSALERRRGRHVIRVVHLLKGPLVRLCFKGGRKEVYPRDHTNLMKS